MQVKTHWDWPNVHDADYYLASMEAIRERNGSRSELVQVQSMVLSHLRYRYTLLILREFRKLGLGADTQSYKIRTGIDSVSDFCSKLSHLTIRSQRVV